MTTDERKPHTPLAEAAALAVALAQAKERIKRLEGEVERWHRLYDNEKARADKLSARVAQYQVIE
jgi:hypothetical protein